MALGQILNHSTLVTKLVCGILIAPWLVKASMMTFIQSHRGWCNQACGFNAYTRASTCVPPFFLWGMYKSLAINNRHSINESCVFQSTNFFKQTNMRMKGWRTEINCGINSRFYAFNSHILNSFSNMFCYSYLYFKVIFKFDEINSDDQMLNVLLNFTSFYRVYYVSILQISCNK